MRATAFFLLVAGCGSGGLPDAPLVVVADDATAPLLADFVAYLEDERVVLETRSDPAAAVEAASSRFRVAVVADLDCVECYRIEPAPGGFVVHGDAPLGVQYGLAHLLELTGYRFFHPEETHRPAAIERPGPSDALGVLHEPDMAQRRGLQLHTLHPIETLYDFWLPGEENLAGARRVIDWLVKNRGNYLQWVFLDDIQGGALDAWRPHTEAIVDYAHLRGIEPGANIQLFGESNLQRAFDLVEGGEPDRPAAIRERLSAIVPEPGFDLVMLSFGEFSAVDPMDFVDGVNEVRDALRELDPDAEMGGFIHVGNYPETRITYMGRELLYYFLVDYAPDVTPWVHTVMYYNLFDPTGGAYLHDEFDEHRAYILERLAAGEPVGYQPETAYWVAFDNSVPTYLPVYVLSRFIDASMLPGLQEHMLFSTGWEWGYWQNDYAALRLSYDLPDRFETLFDEMWAAYGPGGAELAGALSALAVAQREGLIESRLTPYLAGRDSLIDIGRTMGIVSQPDRPPLEEVAALDATGRDAFLAAVVDPLADLAAAHQSALDRARAAGLPADDPFVAETLDGIEVTLLRARFAEAIWRAAASPARPADLGAARAALDAALPVVERRHAALHDPDGDRLVRRGRNPTIYMHGYLHYADDLCYWRRELAEADNALNGAGLSVPGCIL